MGVGTASSKKQTGTWEDVQGVSSHGNGQIFVFAGVLGVHEN